MPVVQRRATHRECEKCHDVFEIANSRLWICSPCYQAEEKAKNAKQFWTLGKLFGTPFVWLISFAIFPLGLFLYAMWRKHDKWYAWTALIGALMGIFIVYIFPKIIQ